MARLALLAFYAGFGLAWWLATRNAAQPCPEYKVYDETKVQELDDEIRVRRMSK